MAIVKQVILGSSSTFRQKLLKSTGLTFTSEAAPIDEKSIGHSDPRIVAEKRGIGKARALSDIKPGALIIGADQTLSLNGKLFEKASSRMEAKTCLEKLSGQTYYLHTGYCFAFKQNSDSESIIIHKELIDTPLTLRTLSEKEIESYLDTNEWHGVLGCNRIEGQGINLHTPACALNTHTIIGLPLAYVLAALRKLGINPLTHPAPPWNIEPIL